jgi:hypothetical protein
MGKLALGTAKRRRVAIFARVLARATWHREHALDENETPRWSFIK